MFHIDSTVAVLEPGLGVTDVAVTPDLFERLHRDFEGFRGRWLMMRHAFEKSWSGWERHPAGEEIVYLLSGDVEMILERPEGESSMRLSEPGSYLVVPRNTWHTANVHAPAHMLFITPGEGTEHRPRR